MRAFAGQSTRRHPGFVPVPGDLSAMTVQHLCPVKIVRHREENLNGVTGHEPRDVLIPAPPLRFVLVTDCLESLPATTELAH